MALIKCRNCGKKLFDKAVRCPHCGATYNHSSSQEFHDNRKREESNFTESEQNISISQDNRRKKRAYSAAAIFFIILVIVWIVAFFLMQPKYDRYSPYENSELIEEWPAEAVYDRDVVVAVEEAPAYDTGYYDSYHEPRNRYYYDSYEEVVPVSDSSYAW